MLALMLLALVLLGSAHDCPKGSSYEASIVCRITKPATLVLNQETTKVIQTAFQRASYPDIEGEKSMMFLGRVKYGLHNIQIGHLSIASSQVELVDGRSIDISIRNVSGAFRGTLNYGYTSAWGLGLAQSVDFEIDSSIDLQINTELTCDSGQVRANTLNCYLSFHKLLLKLHGDREPGWFKQLFTDFISFTLKMVLKRQVCKEVSVISNIMADFVQRRAADFLSDRDIEVDISLARSPVINASYLESHHKGYVIYRNVSQGLPVPAFAPSLLGDRHMLYFWFSEQVLDSLAQAAFHEGRFTLSLTADELKAMLETQGLNTDQDMFQELFAGSPSSQAQVAVHCLQPPKIVCRDQGVLVNSSVMVKFLTTHPDQPPSVTYTYQEDLATTVQASYSKKQLFLKLQDFQITPKTVSNQTENSEAVHSFLRSAITTVGIPEVMSRLEVALTAFMNSKGLDLFEIINPEIVTRDGYLLLQMDFGFPEHLLVDFLQRLT